VSNTNKNLCCLILGVDCPLPCPLFPVYRFFFPVAVIASFGVRVYVSIVAGGSLTSHIVTQSRPKRTGFLPNFLMKINRKVSKALAAAFLALSVVLLAESSWGHPGRTDANGCHSPNAMQ
jgi:hypothetical protein